MADTKAKVEDDEIEALEEDEGVEVVAIEEEPGKVRAKPETPDDDDEPEDREDTRLKADDPEREEIRERRRLERKKRRDNDRAAKRENAELRRTVAQQAERLAKLEQTSTRQEMGNVDARINMASNRAKEATRVHAEAIKAGDTEAAAEAMEIHDAAVFEARQLAFYRQGAEQANKTKPPVQKPDNTAMVKHRTAFMADHAWYDPDSDDEDSEELTRIDSEIFAEGYNQNTPAYWNELRRRAKEELPHKFVPAKAKGGPITGMGRGTGSSRREVRVTAERKRAMQAAGFWDDPKQRNEMLKEYAKFDAENSNA